MGREGWEFDEDGQGAITNVIQGLGTTSAFTPAAYSASLINDLLLQSGLTMADIEVRLKRAQNIAGTTSSDRVDVSGTQVLQHANAGPRGYYRTRVPYCAGHVAL